LYAKYLKKDVNIKKKAKKGSQLPTPQATPLLGFPPKKGKQTTGYTPHHNKYKNIPTLINI